MDNSPNRIYVIILRNILTKMISILGFNQDIKFIRDLLKQIKYNKEYEYMNIKIRHNKISRIHIGYGMMNYMNYHLFVIIILLVSHI